MKKLLTLFLSVILYSSAVSAQSGTLSTTFLSLPDTSYLGMMDTGNIVVKNIDNAPYTGSINVNYSTDTVAFNLAGFFTIPNVTLNPGDSIISTINITFDSTFYNPGNNIVVVWSSGNAKFAADTIWDSVYLIGQTASIYENGLSPLLTIFPSPASDMIYIKSSLPKEGLQQLKITDVFGRTVYTTSPSGNETQKISVAHLHPGLYFLEMMYANRKRAVQKFVKVD